MMTIEIILNFYKCRTSSTTVECLKTDATGAQTFVLRLTIHCFTTAPHLPWRNWDYSVYRLHTSYVNCIPLLFFWSRWEWSASFLNPLPTVHHIVRICMGLLIHKTSFFLALFDKFLCKNKGGGVLSLSQHRIGSTLREYFLFRCTHLFFRLF